MCDVDTLIVVRIVTLPAPLRAAATAKARTAMAKSYRKSFGRPTKSHRLVLRSAAGAHLQHASARPGVQL